MPSVHVRLCFTSHERSKKGWKVCPWTQNLSGSSSQLSLHQVVIKCGVEKQQVVIKCNAPCHVAPKLHKGEVQWCLGVLASCRHDVTDC